MSGPGTILGHLSPISHNADEVDYDNTASGLTATDAQAAIDEVAAAVASENLWDRTAITSTLVPHTANDNVDLGSGNILTTGTVDGRNVSADGSALDSHLDGTGNKHDASEIDVEGTYANISGTPTDLENTVSAIDTKLGTIVTDHGALTGLGDDDHTQYVQKSTLTTNGDLFYRASGVVSRFPIGTSGQYLKTNASSLPEWTTVSMPTAPNREIIVSSGGSTAVNAAITTLNGLGGGIVRLDGMIDMDGNITMKSNVQLVGYGPGTGLRNNTANNYKINFIGTTPTYYNIAAPGYNANSIYCDTVAQAGNFAVGDFIIVKDDTGLLAYGDFFQVSTAGDTGTGKVQFYENTGYHLGFFTAASVAAPLKSAVTNAGIRDCEIRISSSGTLSIDIQYAAQIKIQGVSFYETTMTIHDCGRILLDRCVFDVITSKTFGPYITFTYWANQITISFCSFLNAYYGMKWETPYTSLANLRIVNNIFSCAYAIYFVNSTKALLWQWDISRNFVQKCADPSSGANGQFLRIRATNYYGLVIGNEIPVSTANYMIQIAPYTYLYSYYLAIENNMIGGSVNVDYLYNSTIIGNVIATFVLDYGPSNSCITNNTISTFYLRDENQRQVYGNSICGNSIASACYFDGDSSRPFESNVFSSNFVSGAVYCSSYFIKNNFSNNVFRGSVTLTSGAGQTWGKNILSSNYFNSTATFTEANQSDNVIVGNISDTAITTLTGSNNEVAHNVVF